MYRADQILLLIAMKKINCEHKCLGALFLHLITSSVYPKAFSLYPGHNTIFAYFVIRTIYRIAAYVPTSKTSPQSEMHRHASIMDNRILKCNAVSTQIRMQIAGYMLPGRGIHVT